MSFEPNPNLDLAELPLQHLPLSLSLEASDIPKRNQKQ